MSTPTKSWISLARAGEKLGVDRHAVKRLAENGHLTMRLLPGTHPRVWSPDVDRLAERSTRPARQS